MRDWLNYLLYEGAYLVSMTGFTLGFSLRLEGKRHVPPYGPALLIANHQSYLDPALVGLAARRHLFYLARKTLFHHPTFTWLIRSLNAVPVDQEGIGIEGLRTILRLLEEGKAVIIFPEGERTRDGAIHPLQPGVQLLIKKAQVPVVPVGIAGAYDAWPCWRPIPVPAPLFMPPGKGTVAVVVGRPLAAKALADLSREQVLASLKEELQKVHDQAEQLRRK